MKSRLFLRQATRKELLCNEPQYRRRFHRYLISLMCLCCLLLPFYLSFFGFRLFGFQANQWLILSIAAVIVILTLRQFQFQKQSIRTYLEMNRQKTNGGTL